MLKGKHNLSHTVEGAKALNACGRYVSVSVLRYEVDCTNGGVSSSDNHGHPSFFAPCPEGNFLREDLEGTDPTKRFTVILEVIPPAFPGCAYRFKVAGETRRPMAGGNFIFTSDSRFSEAYGQPISLHDRHE